MHDKKKSDHHDSVLFDEAISALSIKSNGIYIDATLGRGGHTQGILSSLKKSGKVIGFDQDIEAIKYAKKNKLGFLAIEYSGHGKSSGEFTKGNISKWTSDTRVLIKNIIKKNDFVLIGSSMGSWISLNQFKYFKKQIKGFLGIGSAPEFLEKIMWKKFTKKMKAETKKNGVYNLKHGGYEYPITYQLIKDGKKNKILHKKIVDYFGQYCGYAQQFLFKMERENYEKKWL